MAGLKDLPPEVARLVLTHLDDPNDLVSAVRSSAVFYRSIKIFPWQIIVDILTATITPQGLPHALALAHFDSYKDCGPVYALQPAMDLSSLEFPKETAALLEIWRTHMTITSLIDDYSRSAISEIRQSAYANTVRFDSVGNVATRYKALSHTTTPQRPDSVELSSTERGRMERAFYRLELYCRIHPEAWWYDEDTHSWSSRKASRAIDRYGLFGKDWQPWETAEMIAVHDGLNRMVRMRIWRLQREFSAAVLQVPGIQFLPPPTLGNPKPKAGHGRCFLYDLHRQGLYAYSNARDSDLTVTAIRVRHASELVGHGVKFVSQLLSSDVPTYKSMVRVDRRHSFRCLPYEFFRRSLVDNGYSVLPGGHRHPKWLNTTVTAQMEGITADEDGLRCGTSGFRKYYKDVLRGYSGRPNVSNPRLARTATPFWDADRMRTPEFVSGYQKIHDRVESRNDQVDFFYSSFTAEKYLTGITIPVEHYRRLQREFGFFQPLKSKQGSLNSKQTILNLGHARQNDPEKA